MNILFITTSIIMSNTSFDVSVMNQDKVVKGLTLANKINVILISDPRIFKSACCVGVRVGYLQDEFPGTAHFLEHLLFMGSEKYPTRNEFQAYISTCNGTYNAFTQDNKTCYYIELETTFLKKGIDMLSWFFRKPLLNMNHIESEREIIDSEHQKNILSEAWIIDDIVKKLMVKDSKYRRFGTGNAESLKDITKEDILSMYHKYYTTDNMYVCIIDSKTIPEMEREYVPCLSDIEERIYIGDDRFTTEQLRLKDDNIAIYKPVSEYNMIMILLFVDCDYHNIVDFQLMSMFTYLLGVEYEQSLAYYLKEGELINDMFARIDYTFDYQMGIEVQFMPVNNQHDAFNTICYLFEKYISAILRMSEHEFQMQYENFQKIKHMRALYNTDANSTELTTRVVDNMITSNLSESIIRKYFVPDYEPNTYKRFMAILATINPKIITNINILNEDVNEFKTSKWYGSKYFTGTYKVPSEHHNVTFKLNNIIGIKNSTVEATTEPDIVHQDALPKLVSCDDKRTIYLQEYTKYGKPLCSISVIRKNPLYLIREYNLIIAIYETICDWILNYYANTMASYKLSYSVSSTTEHLTWTFNGPCNVINQFIQKIAEQINHERMLHDDSMPRYFERAKAQITQNLVNFRYEMPYVICTSYASSIMHNYYTPSETLKHLSNLTYQDYIEKLAPCLQYQHEYYMIVGTPDYKSIVKTLGDDNMFTTEHNEYVDNEIMSRSLDYALSPRDINPNEKNNCIMYGYIMTRETVPVEDDRINREYLDVILKNILVYDIVADLISEPLFDKIRTQDKLGYIVRDEHKHVFKGDYALSTISYIIQSTYPIKKIVDSIEEFNKQFMDSLNDDRNAYTDKFHVLKRSKMLDLEKPYTSIAGEAIAYRNILIDKIGMFDVHKHLFDILERVEFADVMTAIEYMLSRAQKFQVVLVGSQSKLSRIKNKKALNKRRI